MIGVRDMPRRDGRTQLTHTPQKHEVASWKHAEQAGEMGAASGSDD